MKHIGCHHFIVTSFFCWLLQRARNATFMSLSSLSASPRLLCLRLLLFACAMTVLVAEAQSSSVVSLLAGGATNLEAGNIIKDSAWWLNVPFDAVGVGAGGTSITGISVLLSNYHCPFTPSTLSAELTIDAMKACSHTSDCKGANHLGKVSKDNVASGTWFTLTVSTPIAIPPQTAVRLTIINDNLVCDVLAGAVSALAANAVVNITYVAATTAAPTPAPPPTTASPPGPTPAPWTPDPNPPPRPNPPPPYGGPTTLAPPSSGGEGVTFLGYIFIGLVVYIVLGVLSRALLGCSIELDCPVFLTAPMVVIFYALFFLPGVLLFWCVYPLYALMFGIMWCLYPLLVCFDCIGRCLTCDDPSRAISSGNISCKDFPSPLFPFRSNFHRKCMMRLCGDGGDGSAPLGGDDYLANAHAATAMNSHHAAAPLYGQQAYTAPSGTTSACK